MRVFISIILLLMPMVTFAQDGRGMDNIDMQKMMEQMQKMQDCMKNIDQSELKKLEQRSYQVGEEIKSLCASGKRDEAEKKAIAFSIEMANDPTMQEITKCRDNIEINMPNMPNMPYMDQEEEDSEGHVCD